MFKQLQTALFGKKVKGNELMYYISLLSSSLKNPLFTKIRMPG